ncbi:MAG: LolA family protein [Terriglobales bacterium]
MRRRRPPLVPLLALVFLLAAFAPRQQKSWTLPQVLAALTRAAPAIHSVSAAAAVVDYTALVQEADHSAGQLYFEQGAHGPRYLLDLTTPKATAKKLIYTGQTAYVYTPSAQQVVKYSMSAHPQEIDQYILLGMGATGAQLEKSFLVTLDGPDSVDGRAAVKLTLTPRSPRLQGRLTHLDIWFDPATWLGIQQQMWQPGGDYHLLTLSRVQLNPQLSVKLFSTDFPGATVIVPHF